MHRISYFQFARNKALIYFMLQTRMGAVCYLECWLSMCPYIEINKLYYGRTFHGSWSLFNGLPHWSSIKRDTLWTFSCPYYRRLMSTTTYDCHILILINEESLLSAFNRCEIYASWRQKLHLRNLLEISFSPLPFVYSPL